MTNAGGENSLNPVDAYEIAKRDRFVCDLGVKLIEARPGYAVTELLIEDRHLNFNGVAQGGVTFTLADAAFGYACNQYGVIAGGIEAHICFTKPVRAGETLTAIATEISRSKRMGNYRIEVRNGANDLVASLSGTAVITDRPMQL